MRLVVVVVFLLLHPATRQRVAERVVSFASSEWRVVSFVQSVCWFGVGVVAQAPPPPPPPPLDKPRQHGQKQVKSHRSRHHRKRRQLGNELHPIAHLSSRGLHSLSHSVHFSQSVCLTLLLHALHSRIALRCAALQAGSVVLCIYFPRPLLGRWVSLQRHCQRPTVYHTLCNILYHITYCI